MIMKILMCQFITALTLTCACAQNSTNPIPPWKVTVNVIEETGQPVTNADVEVSYYVKPPPNQSVASEKISGLTDTKGTFTASHEDTRSATLGFKITKDGYYPSSRGHTLYVPGQFDDKTVTANRNPKLTFVLKKIGKPTQMYARKAHIEIPENDKPIGFDLEEYDWVAPYGRGQRSDFIFQSQRRWASRRDFNSNLKITFSNHGDGLVSMPVPLDKGSALRLPHTAPLDGYASEFSKRLSSTPGKAWTDDVKKDQNYFCRVRTVTDEKGEIKSALYGKIHGDFVTDPINSKTTIIIFTYYLNPESNSRNMEFDPKRNLFNQLSNDEPVDAP